MGLINIKHKNTDITRIEIRIEGSIWVGSFLDYYYYVLGLKQSLFVAKTLQKTEIQDHLAWAINNGEPMHEV